MSNFLNLYMVQKILLLNCGRYADWCSPFGVGAPIPVWALSIFLKTSQLQLIFESTLPQLRRQQLRQQLGAQGFNILSIYLSIYPILSYPILSYPILSYLILSYPILSYLILSYPILSYLILSYPILSYLILSYPILSYLILSYPILSYLILSI